MHAASMRNPEFVERQRQRRSTGGVPRFLRSFDETLAGDLMLPRGLLGLIESLVAEQGSAVEGADERSDGSPTSVEFGATLRDEQASAANAVLGHDLGVLVAPPGAGKTVIACSVIAAEAVPTLVLVDRKALADQWRTQILVLLGVKAGQLGGDRDRSLRRGRGSTAPPWTHCSWPPLVPRPAGAVRGAGAARLAGQGSRGCP